MLKIPDEDLDDEDDDEEDDDGGCFPDDEEADDPLLGLGVFFATSLPAAAWVLLSGELLLFLCLALAMV